MISSYQAGSLIRIPLRYLIFLKVKKELIYSETIKCYYIDILMPKQSQFKFIVDGQYKLSSYYPYRKVNYYFHLILGWFLWEQRILQGTLTFANSEKETSNFKKVSSGLKTY